MRDEMVMVGENSPGFELPAEVACDRKEAAVQHTEPVRATEVMCLFVGAGGDEERAARRELMRRRMRPRSIRLGHGETLSRWPPHTQYWARVSGRPKAVEDYRSPRRFATIKATGKSARSWTAPVLWRFLHTTARTPPVCPSFARQETISPSAHKNHRPCLRRVTCSARASARRALAPRCRRRAAAGPPGLPPVPAARPAPAAVQTARARRVRCHLPPRLRPIGHPG